MALVKTLITIPATVTSTGDVVATTGGEFKVLSGGTISSTVVTDEGTIVLLNGAKAIGTTAVDDGVVWATGQLVVGGTASATVVGAGGLELVGTFAGVTGVTSGALVLEGGREIIGGTTSGFFSPNFNDLLGSGLAEGMNVDGGAAFVQSGGVASGTSVNNGGVVNVTSGGVDNGASVGPDGTLNVSGGGVDSGSSVNGGTMNVFAGGTADKTSVGANGTLNVLTGGVVSALKINDPNDPAVSAEAQVASGGTVDGTTRIDGGQLILDAGADFQAHASLTIMNSGWLILEQDSFKGTIKDFGGSDDLDLTKIRFTGATTETFTPSGAGGTLQVQQGSHVADLHLAGSYSTANFALASDGAHGTLVTFVP